MADFRQLALEFVLEDDENKLTGLAKKTATELQSPSSGANPVARWVEAVQPWMPGSSGDDETSNTPDWPARAKALDFLSRTIDFVKTDFLKPSQVKLMVAFFGAMFDIDHKAGIMASATALSQIGTMKAFHPQSGNDIIEKVCALRDDFPRQTPKTRLAVYQLLRSLITDPEVAKDLQKRHGPAALFMNHMLQLCQSERDPDCLMVWFDTLGAFLENFEFSSEMMEEVYGAFKSYFPITLPRTAQSTVTPEELKLSLRRCFSANHRLSQLTLPFLVGKLDQGQGVTVNVKVDVLRTIKACLEKYEDTENAIKPNVDRIWGSLKYEVRNGEIEDTIWSTLEVLKALTTRLEGDSLRDYTLNVTRDCVNDLSNPLYTASAGRLLVSVLSASPGAFALMVAPIITHVKENLRHPKSPTHGQDLLKILYVILETRILLVETHMSVEERKDFSAADNIFVTLYDDVFKAPVQSGCKSDSAQEVLKNSTEAVQGAGALVLQRTTGSFEIDAETRDAGLLLPSETSSRICNDLFSIILQSFSGESYLNNSDDLVNETAKALQRAVRAYAPGFQFLVDQSVIVIRSSWTTQNSHHDAQSIQKLGPLLAYVGCSELPRRHGDGLNHFLSLIKALTTELLAAIDGKTDASYWCALIAGIESTARYFNDACLKQSPEKGQSVDASAWVSTISEKYPGLGTLCGKTDLDERMEISSITESASPSSSQLRDDYLLISFFVARCLYLRATTRVAADSETGQPSLRLSHDFSGHGRPSEDQYLHLLSGFSSFVVREMDEDQQLSLGIHDLVINLFNKEFIHIPTAISEDNKTATDGKSPWSWLVQERVNILAFGLLQSLRPSAVSRLFDNGVAQELLINGTSPVLNSNVSSIRPVTRSILTVLTNKYKVETLDYLVQSLEQQLVDALKQAQTHASGKDSIQELEQASSVYACVGGMLRRYSGKEADGILQILREAPNHPVVGLHLARRLEMLVAPQGFLAKDSYAVIKPLWVQKVYMQLVKPLLQSALGSPTETQDPQTKTNFSIGVLLMVKHMNFSIYEEDVAKILRVCISVAQNLGAGPDTMAALDVLKMVLAESPDKAQDQLRSLISICLSCFSRNPASKPKRPEWLTAEYFTKNKDAEAEAGCGRVALEVMAALPRLFESRHLLSSGPRVERELSFACGHPVRELRRLARLARGAWAEVK